VATIYQDELRGSLQRKHSPAHRQQAGLQDVEGVDLLHGSFSHGPRAGLFPDGPGQGFPLGGRKLFGVFQPPDRRLRVQDDRGRYYRSCQRSPARLIHAGDPEFSLTFPCWSQLYLVLPGGWLAESLTKQIAQTLFELFERVWSIDLHYLLDHPPVRLIFAHYFEYPVAKIAQQIVSRRFIFER
jgi:hypothetical protein